jgi:hypothetical protein
MSSGWLYHYYPFLYHVSCEQRAATILNVFLLIIHPCVIYSCSHHHVFSPLLSIYSENMNAFDHGNGSSTTSLFVLLLLCEYRTFFVPNTRCLGKKHNHFWRAPLWISLASGQWQGHTPNTIWKDDIPYYARHSALMGIIIILYRFVSTHIPQLQVLFCSCWWLLR